MKHSVKAAVVLVFMFCMVLSAFAQTPAADKSSKDVYVKTMYITKVVPYSLGYKVEYLTASGIVYTTYIPMKWFYGAANKAELVTQENQTVPYMDIVYRDGAFEYVRLVISPDFSHTSWGTARPSEGALEDKFNIDTFSIKY